MYAHGFDPSFHHQGNFGPGKPASTLWLGQAVIAWTVSASIMPVAWTFSLQ